MTLRFATWHMVLAFVVGFVGPLCAVMACYGVLKRGVRASCAIVCGILVGVFIAVLAFYNPVAGGG